MGVLNVKLKKDNTSIENFKVKVVSDKPIFNGEKEKYITNSGDIEYSDLINDVKMEFTCLDNNITKIGDGDTHENNKIKTIILGKGIKEINKNTFNGYTKLSSIEINEEVEKIGNGAFANCPLLSRVVCKPNIPPELGNDVFSGVSENLKIIVNHGAKEAYQGAQGWTEVSEKIQDYGDIVLNENEKQVPGNAHTFTIPFTTIGEVTSLTILPVLGNIEPAVTEATYSGITKEYGVYKTLIDNDLLKEGEYKLYYEDENGNKLGNFEEIYSLFNEENIPWISWEVKNNVIEFNVLENTGVERQVLFNISPNTDTFIKKELLIKQDSVSN